MAVHRTGVAMYNPSYLTLSRHKVYYFRYPLLNNKEQTSYIYLSLRTREPKEALILAKKLEYHSSQIMNQHKESLVNDQEAKQIVGDYLRNKLDKYKREIDKTPCYTNRINKWSSALLSLEHDPKPHTEKFIKDAGIDIETDSEDFQTLHRYVKRNLPDYYKELHEYNERAFNVGLRGEPKTLVRKGFYKLDDVIPKFIEASKTERNWGNGRRHEIISFLEVLKEILGNNFNTNDIDKERAGKVADTIYNLPSRRDTNPLTQGLSILEASKVKDVEKISTGTIKKYIGAYSLFFQWCESRSYCETNPFKSIKANITNKQQEVRYPFSDADISKILAELHNYPKSRIKKEYQYWGILIAMYTGARLNEIAQLEVSDIKNTEEIWYIDVNDNGDKELKTKTSKRKIPIHEKLIKLGFIEYVEKLKKQGKKRVLYQLSWSKKGYGRNLGRFFNESLLPALEIKNKNVSFHCLRHTVNTRLLQNEVELFKIQSILGHTVTTGMTAKYAQEGYKLSQLNNALHKLPY
ncbi:MAG: site-specific integrase [Rickettsiales bacterium]|nr:site-specific integrase [Pseudomonadota bacterium]MDG4544395.1 site-specific integrase [Rickettsiales bacterium]MDG4546525.1 site-specific integrase [Rickettsiales bacterium]